MTDCILSVRAKIGTTGYTAIRRNGKTYREIRWVYAQYHGLDVDNMQGVIMHSCDNRACINIDHLKLGTQAENLLDARRKGRMVTHIPDATIVAIWKAKGTATTRQLANLHNVSQRTVCLIHRGKLRQGVFNYKEVA